MGRRHRRAARVKTARQHHRSANQRLTLPRVLGADRRALLTGTALASTLLIAVMVAPTPAAATTTCDLNPPSVPASPGPIAILNVDDDINCINTETRTNLTGDAIQLSTINSNGNSITLDNSGTLTATNGGDASGINAMAGRFNSAIDIVNSGDITATSTSDDAYGMYIGGVYHYPNSPVTISNSGDITATGSGFATGIWVRTDNVFGSSPNSPIEIVNSGDITAISANEDAVGIRSVAVFRDSATVIDNSGDITAISASDDAYGMYLSTFGDDSNIDLINSGDITARGVDIVRGISADTGSAVNGDNSSIDIVNTGDISATSTSRYGYGIFARIRKPGGAISINNSGDIAASASDKARGIFARGDDDNNAVGIVNSGAVTATSTSAEAYGIAAVTLSVDSSITITNTGPITATSNADDAFGIFGSGGGSGSSVTITNMGPIIATGADNVVGIAAFTVGSAIAITNDGSITATTTGDIAAGIFAADQGSGGSINIVNSGDITVNAVGEAAFGIRGYAQAAGTPISIVNSGDITATGDNDAIGLFAFALAGNGPISIVNSGDVRGTGPGRGGGIAAISPNGSVRIENSGSAYGSYAGIFVQDGTGTTIVNSGTIASGADRAIYSGGTGQTQIYNSGTITGFVDLTEQDDTFTNQSGGVFETKMTSLFGGGNDLFRNQSGGFVQAATDRDAKETSSFEGLERFENRGTISMVDGAVGDSFTLSNTPGGTDLNFVGGSGSTLSVDVSLGGPGSGTDSFIIQGNVSGTTTVMVNNTNTVGGEFNPDGIKIVTVSGATPNANAFTLDAPVDAGFFDYDLFFTPTGSGFWSLKSFPGAGAHMLPQLVTAAQDMWHQGSSTWFDRTADLRVLVNGGAANAAYSQDGAAQNDGIAPAVWVRGSGGWLDRDGSGSTSSNGRNYKFDLDRQLDTMDFQMGLDLGSRDLLSQGDALVFGLLGGFVHGDLDYDSINRNFDYDGGQVGAYATYMKGGLFVDTLLNVHIMELDANGALGFPNNDLDATTVGLRSDAGYRFGSFSGGAFLEPLATIEVTWADIDGFALGGNSVKFDDDANVRGRLGLRAGTTMEAWDGTMMEPFVTGSLWGNLSGENQATLTSNGSSFRYEDNIDDVWGELSAGVNFFNFSQTTSVFAKVDVTLGDDVTGLGGKAGMRVAW